MKTVTVLVEKSKQKKVTKKKTGIKYQLGVRMTRNLGKEHEQIITYNFQTKVRITHYYRIEPKNQCAKNIIQRMKYQKRKLNKKYRT